MSLISTLREWDSTKSSGTEPKTLDALARSIRSWMNAWPSQHGSVDVLRASGMFFTCPREFILNYWQPTPYRKFDWRSRMMMSMGEHLHHYMQNQVLGPMGVLYGDWYDPHSNTLEMAREKGLTVRGFHPDPDRAIKEVQEQWPLTWVYGEDAVWSGYWRISGHIDGLIDKTRLDVIRDALKMRGVKPFDVWREVLKVPPSDLMLFELKTTSKYLLDKLKSADDIADYYKMQAAIYQRLSDTPTTLFWFVERDSMAAMPLIYRYDRGWWSDAKRKAKVIWTGVRDETLPDAGVCKTPMDTRAKKCVFREQCFGKRFKMCNWIKKGREDESREFLNLTKWDADTEDA